MSKQVVIYTTGFCGYCSRAKRLLDSKGVKYEEIRIDLHPEKREEMLTRSRGGYTVPQIFIEDFHVGGCDDLYALEGKGQLNPQLGLVSVP